mgnify:FL=1|tara:strand:+ start:4023 stop:4949 length:927 start_codon:yes stop_codon:yes gene_type:complete
MKKLFPYVIALSALSVSASAALYSVVGLSKLFAGAKVQVMIMAGSLEFAKLVIASVLYQYWDKTNAFIKTYLMIALIILITITSGGIYGYLSGAYQETSNQSEFLDKEVAIIDSKRIRYEEQRNDYKTSIQTWTEALANPTQIQYVDKESGQLVTTTSSRQRKLLEAELKETKISLSAVTDSISVLDMKILDMQLNNEAARELGPLKYMAKLFDKSMDEIINWFMVMIIFVFDPLAIVLVVIANQAFSTGAPRKPEEIVINTKYDQGDLYGEELPGQKEIIADETLTIRQKMNKWQSVEKAREKINAK